MSRELLQALVITSFDSFLVETPTVDLKLGLNPPCLADFIDAWVRDGEGVRVCMGSYETFLVAVILITEEWVNRPGCLDYLKCDADGNIEEVFERRVTSVFGEASVRHRILNPDFFAMCAFSELHGGMARTSKQI